MSPSIGNEGSQATAHFAKSAIRGRDLIVTDGSLPSPVETASGIKVSLEA